MTRATIDPTSVATALADPAFAGLAGGPVIVAGGSPIRLLHASAQALALFQAGDISGLEERLLNGSEPGARRLAELAVSLQPGPPRLERLRFYVGGASEAITFLCKRMAGEIPMFVAGAIGVRQSLLGSAPAQKAAGAGADASLDPGAVQSSAPEQPARPANVRFLWRTDPDLRFTRFDEGGCEALGCAPGALLGASMLELAGMPGFDPDGRLCAALMRRETWSGVEVNWPLADGGAYAPVVMGALPTFDKSRAFSGFSGFGVVHLDRIAQRAAPTNDDLAADIADEIGAAQSDAADADQASVAEMAEIAQLINDPDLIGADAVEEDTTAEDAPSEALEAMTPMPREAEAPAAGGAFNNVVTLNAWKSGGGAAPAPTPPRADAVEPAEPVRAPSNSTASAAQNDEFPSEPGEEEELVRLTPAERHAFREIARALGARIEDADKRRAQRDERKSDQIKSQSLGNSAPTADDSAGATAAAPAGEAPEDMAAPSTAGAMQAAAAPADSRAMARLLDRIDAGLMVCREGEAVFLNKCLLETLRYNTFEDFSAAGGVSRMFRGRTPEAAAANGAVPVVRGDGETIALEGRLTTIEWDGAPAMLTTFRRTSETDLATRLRALELDLRAREAEGRELHAILDTATDGVAILDGEGRILGLNRSAEALFGYEQNEVAGEPFTILFATESHPAALDYLSGLKSNGVRSVLNDGREVLGRARQGGMIPMFMTIGRIGADSSKFCVVMRDMTQWKNAERELKDARRDAEHASALKSDFLAKISHEVRTPLNAILGFAEVIIEERFGPIGNERYKDYLKDIHASGTHVMSLVNDLLDLSKIEAGKLELNFGSVDANRIINECVSMMQAQAIRERVIIRLSLAPRFPNIVADERALRQIVLNLLSNAVKFNQPGGQVIVSTALTDSGDAVIRVRDNGVGMNDKEVETALEPFRQIQTSRQTTGTGLGLPLTKALVEANRAAFTIRSRKGEGTLVEVSFPSTRVLAE